MSATDIDDAWGPTPTPVPVATAAATSPGATSARLAHTAPPAQPNAPESADALVRGLLAELAMDRDAAEARERTFLIGALVVAAALIHYLDRVHSRLQTLETLLARRA
jgi:hypothetical protein